MDGQTDRQKHWLTNKDLGIARKQIEEDEKTVQEGKDMERKDSIEIEKKKRQ